MNKYQLPKFDFLPFSVLFLFLFTSCETVIDVEITEKKQYLIIEGSLKNYSDNDWKYIEDSITRFTNIKRDVQKITLSKSFDIFTQTENIALDTADKVYVVNKKTLDTTNFRQLYTISNNQLKKSYNYSAENLIIEPNTEYELNVITTIDGVLKHYISIEKANYNPGIDGDLLQYDIEEKGLSSSGGKFAVLKIKNITSNTFLTWNAYYVDRFKHKLNLIPISSNRNGPRRSLLRGDYLKKSICGNVVYRFSSKFWESDSIFLDGANNLLSLNPTSAGDYILLEQISISKNQFFYLFNFYSASSQATSDIPQGPIKGNGYLINSDGTTNTDDYTLGFFNVATSSFRGLKIEDTPEYSTAELTTYCANYIQQNAI